MSVNERVAVFVTKHVSTMYCAYVFTILAIWGGLGVDWHNSLQVVQWVSQTFLQLVFLPIILVGQAVLSKASDLQAREMHDAVLEELQDAREARQVLLDLNTNLLTEMAEIKTMHQDLDLFLKQVVERI